MEPPLPIERREIIEERGNRDAFVLSLFLCVILILLLGCAIVIAWNTRFIALPFHGTTERPAATAPAKLSAGFLGIIGGVGKAGLRRPAALQPRSLCREERTLRGDMVVTSAACGVRPPTSPGHEAPAGGGAT